MYLLFGRKWTSWELESWTNMHLNLKINVSFMRPFRYIHVDYIQFQCEMDRLGNAIPQNRRCRTFHQDVGRIVQQDTNVAFASQRQGHALQQFLSGTCGGLTFLGHGTRSKVPKGFKRCGDGRCGCSWTHLKSFLVRWRVSLLEVSFTLSGLFASCVPLFPS